MLKIFEIIHEDGEKEWCTGSTNIDALSNYVSTTGCDLFDMGDSEIIELPKDKWSLYKITDEDQENCITFEEWMNGSGNDREIIAGTMYD